MEHEYGLHTFPAVLFLHFLFSPLHQSLHGTQNRVYGSLQLLGELGPEWRGGTCDGTEQNVMSFFL